MIAVKLLMSHIMMPYEDNKWHIIFSLSIDENQEVVGKHYLIKNNSKFYPPFYLDNEMVGRYYSIKIDRSPVQSQKDILNILLKDIKESVDEPAVDIKKISKVSIINAGDKGAGKIFVPVVEQIEDAGDRYRASIILLRYHYLSKYFKFSSTDQDMLTKMDYIFAGIGYLNERPVDKWVKKHEFSKEHNIHDVFEWMIRENKILHKFSRGVKDRNVLSILESNLR